mmetsp:Transcript_868/g.1359  ORF Transcript_868/g.1359 Transcript_868/m.1359 type:complete len:251 (-) Transcript_868:1496-2248(-)
MVLDDIEMPVFRTIEPVDNVYPSDYPEEFIETELQPQLWETMMNNINAVYNPDMATKKEEDDKEKKESESRKALNQIGLCFVCCTVLPVLLAIFAMPLLVAVAPGLIFLINSQQTRFTTKADREGYLTGSIICFSVAGVAVAVTVFAVIGVISTIICCIAKGKSASVVMGQFQFYARGRKPKKTDKIAKEINFYSNVYLQDNTPFFMRPHFKDYNGLPDIQLGQFQNPAPQVMESMNASPPAFPSSNSYQ